MKSILYAEHSWPEIKEMADQDKVLLLPIGSVEQHGLHLPLELDSLTAFEMSKKAALGSNGIALVMPPIYYTYTGNQMDFPGSVDVDPNHIIDYLFDICKSVTQHGFRRIILVSGHGGNTPYLTIVSQKVGNNTPALCCGFEYWDLAREKVSKIISHECHAGELETSLLLALKPEVVDMSKAEKDMNIYMNQSDSKWAWANFMKGAPVKFEYRWSAFSKTGTLGDPTIASKEKGEQVIDAIIEDFVEYIKEFKNRKFYDPVDHH